MVLHQDGEPQSLEMIIVGVTITLSTVWDALSLFYKIKLTIPKLKHLADQIKFLIQHQKQLAEWISLSHRLPTVINMMWKSDPVRSTEDHQFLIRGNTNRHQRHQAKFR